MKLQNRIALRLESHPKCELVCDNDAPLGSLFDYACSLKVFLVDKMQAEQKAQEKAEADAKAEEEQPKVEG